MNFFSTSITVLAYSRKFISFTFSDFISKLTYLKKTGQQGASQTCSFCGWISLNRIVDFCLIFHNYLSTSPDFLRFLLKSSMIRYLEYKRLDKCLYLTITLEKLIFGFSNKCQKCQLCCSVPIHRRENPSRNV